jgi:hypothetical protein
MPVRPGKSCRLSINASALDSWLVTIPIRGIFEEKNDDCCFDTKLANKPPIFPARSPSADAYVTAAAFAGPREEANAAIDRRSAAYSSNDPEAVVKIIDLTRLFSAPRVPLYPRGPMRFRAYFAPLKGSGNKIQSAKGAHSCSVITP